MKCTISRGLWVENKLTHLGWYLMVIGKQNLPHQNVPLRHRDYFISKKLKTQEGTLTFPLIALENLEKRTIARANYKKYTN